MVHSILCLFTLTLPRGRLPPGVVPEPAGQVQEAGEAAAEGPLLAHVSHTVLLARHDEGTLSLPGKHRQNLPTRRQAERHAIAIYFILGDFWTFSSDQPDYARTFSRLLTTRQFGSYSRLLGWT